MTTKMRGDQLDTGTGANQIVQLDGSGQLPAGIGAGGLFTEDGNFNIVGGTGAGTGLTGSAYQNFIAGSYAGSNITSGDGNIIIGNSAGPTTDQSNQLYINNSESNFPLIHGDFTAPVGVTINGTHGRSIGTGFGIYGTGVNYTKDYLLHAQTNGAETVQVSTIYGGSPPLNIITIPSKQKTTTRFEINVMANEFSGSKHASWKLRGLFNTAGTTVTLVGSVTKEVEASYAALGSPPILDVNVAAATGGFVVEVTNTSTGNVIWSVDAKTQHIGDSSGG